MNIENNLKIIILLIFTINIYLMIVSCIIAFTLNNSFTMYNKKFDYMKELILQTNKEKRKSNKENRIKKIE